MNPHATHSFSPPAVSAHFSQALQHLTWHVRRWKGKLELAAVGRVKNCTQNMAHSSTGSQSLVTMIIILAFLKCNIPAILGPACFSNTVMHILSVSSHRPSKVPKVWLFPPPSGPWSEWNNSSGGRVSHCFYDAADEPAIVFPPNSSLRSSQKGVSRLLGHCVLAERSGHI